MTDDYLRNIRTALCATSFLFTSPLDKDCISQYSFLHCAVAIRVLVRNSHEWVAHLGTDFLKGGASFDIISFQSIGIKVAQPQVFRPASLGMACLLFPIDDFISYNSS